MRIRIVLLAFLTGSISGCADQLVLPPTPAPYLAPGTKSRMIDRDGRALEAFIARSAGAANRDPAAFVLRFTGGDASGAAAFTASRWGNRPVEVWVVNYPGFGRSAGPRRLGLMTPAALAAFDELHSLAGNRPIYVEGFSLGTVPALALAARRPVAGLIL